MPKAAANPARSQPEPQRIAAGEFKAKCLRLMDEVQRTQRPLVITKRGKPVVRVVPAEIKPPRLYGALKGWATIKGDIVSPIYPEWTLPR